MAGVLELGPHPGKPSSGNWEKLLPQTEGRTGRRPQTLLYRGSSRRSAGITEESEDLLLEVITELYQELYHE